MWDGLVGLILSYLFTVHCTLYTVHCTLYTVHLHYTLFTHTLYTIQCNTDILHNYFSIDDDGMDVADKMEDEAPDNPKTANAHATGQKAPSRGSGSGSAVRTSTSLLDAKDAKDVNARRSETRFKRVILQLSSVMSAGSRQREKEEEEAVRVAREWGQWGKGVDTASSARSTTGSAGAGVGVENRGQGQGQGPNMQGSQGTVPDLDTSHTSHTSYTSMPGVNQATDAPVHEVLKGEETVSSPVFITSSSATHSPAVDISPLDRVTGRMKGVGKRRGLYGEEVMDVDEISLWGESSKKGGIGDIGGHAGAGAGSGKGTVSVQPVHGMYIRYLRVGPVNFAVSAAGFKWLALKNFKLRMENYVLKKTVLDMKGLVREFEKHFATSVIKATATTGLRNITGIFSRFDGGNKKKAREQEEEREKEREREEILSDSDRKGHLPIGPIGERDSSSNHMSEGRRSKTGSRRWLTDLSAHSGGGSGSGRGIYGGSGRYGSAPSQNDLEKIQLLLGTGVVPVANRWTNNHRKL